MSFLQNNEWGLMILDGMFLANLILFFQFSDTQAQNLHNLLQLADIYCYSIFQTQFTNKPTFQLILGIVFDADIMILLFQRFIPFQQNNSAEF